MKASPEGIYFTVNLYPKGSYSLSTVYTAPNFQVPFPDPSQPWGSMRCEITNYTRSAIINLRIPIAILYRNVVIQTIGGSKQTHTADVFSAENSELRVPKVEPGEAGRFIFYMSNTSNKWTDVKFGSNGTAQSVEEEIPRSINILQPEINIDYSLTPDW